MPYHVPHPDAALTEGPVGRHLVRLTSPTAVGVLAVMSIGIADAYFVGRLGTEPLAAVGFAYPIIIAVNSLGIGAAAGIASVVARALGSDDPEAARRAAVAGMALAALIGLAVMGIGLSSGEVLFSILGAGSQKDGGALPLVMAFMRPWFVSFAILMAGMAGTAILRAHGMAKRAALVMVIEAVVNVALDPVLIYGLGPSPEFGIAGAGYATIIARLCGLMIVSMMLVHRHLLAIRGASHRGIRKSALAIARVGAPAAFGNALNPLGLAAVTAILAAAGDTAVAGYGAANRVESFILVPLLALSGTIGPVVGQNWGADDEHRARRAVALSWGFCLAYALAIAVILFLFGETVAGWFTDDEAAIGVAVDFFRVVPWTLTGYGVLIVTNAALNGSGRPVPGLVVSIARIALLLVPGAWIGMEMAGPVGAFWGLALSNVAGGLASLVAARRVRLLPRTGDRGRGDLSGQ